MEQDKPSYRYAAFISYRHEPLSRKWAKWLHRAIETYSVPKALVKQRKIRRRVGRIFRDEEELAASADLSKKIDEALEESNFLIVVCTPRTPESRWVNAEIERFHALGRGERILPLLVAGDPHASFPPALTQIRINAPDDESRSGDPNLHHQVEPLAADVRDVHNEGQSYTRMVAKLRLIATILDVDFYDLRNRDQRRQRTQALQMGAASLAATAVLAILLVYAISQQRLAARSLKEVTQQKAEVERQRTEADRRRDESDAAVKFITEDVLSGANPQRMPNRAVREQIVNVMLDPAAAAVAQRFPDKPRIEAAIRNMLAETYQSIGRSDLGVAHASLALEIRRRLLGDDHPDTMTSINTKGFILHMQRKLTEAEPLYREALERRRRLLGDDHPDTLVSIQNLGGLLQSAGKLVEAEALWREALERRGRVLGNDHPDTLVSLSSVAYNLQSLDKADEAEPILREVLERRRRTLGNDNPRTLISISNVGGVLQDQARHAEAESLFSEALERSRRVLGDNHPDTLRSVHNMAGVLEAQGKLLEAEPLYREALERRRRVLGEDHPETLSAMNSLGVALKSRGKLAEAEPLLVEALERRRRVLGDNYLNTLRSMSNLGSLLKAQGKLVEAESLFREALNRASNSPDLGASHSWTKKFAENLVSCLRALNRPDEAAAVREKFALPDPTTHPSSTGSAVSMPTAH